MDHNLIFLLGLSAALLCTVLVGISLRIMWRLRHVDPAVALVDHPRKARSAFLLGCAGWWAPLSVLLSLAWLALSGFTQPYSAGVGAGEAIVVAVPALAGVAVFCGSAHLGGIPGRA